MQVRTRCRLLSMGVLVVVLGCGGRAEIGGGTVGPRNSAQQDAGVVGLADAAAGATSDGSVALGGDGTNAVPSAGASVALGEGGANAVTTGGTAIAPLGAGGTSATPDSDCAAMNSSYSGGAAANRIVAIGDLHADIGATRRAFRLAGATNENDEWIGGSLTIVQLGDLVGRSDDERQVLDFVFEMRKKAESGGGKIHNLIGNHEVMAARVDNQAVGANPFPGFEDLADLARDDPRLQILPENQRARGAALMAGGPIAKRLAEFPTVLRIGQTIFVHGGIAPRWAEYGIATINQEISQWFLGNTAEPDSSLGYDDGDRVVWSRQFSSLVDATDCAVLEQSLSILGAKRMVVAHTVQSAIASNCGNKVWAVDVGMSRYYGGSIEVLQIVDDEILTVLHC